MGVAQSSLMDSHDVRTLVVGFVFLDNLIGRVNGGRDEIVVRNREGHIAFDRLGRVGGQCGDGIYRDGRL